MSIGLMKVKITRVPQDISSVIDIKKGEKVQTLLKRLNLRSDTVIVLRGSVPIPIDDTLDDEQDLHIFQVASGG